MGWNGSGVFERTNGTNSGANLWQNDRDAGIKITAENHDNQDQDLADGIQNCLTKDGQNYPTADLPLNNQKHTGVGAATAATHYARADQVQNGAFIWGGTAAGTADAITFNLTPTLTAYTTGLTVRFLASGTTTVTNPTININAAGAKTVKDQDGNALSVGDIASGTVYEAVYDGTDFRIYVAASQDLSDYVQGPASATDNAVALFDGTGGKTLKDGVLIGVASGNIQRVNQAETTTASATTTTLGTSLKHGITGTTTITAFNGVAGVTYHCRADGAFILTHDATNLDILQTGANITTAADDTFDVYMRTTTACEIRNYQRSSGEALAGGTEWTPLTDKSVGAGTSISYTGIAPGAQQINLYLDAVSLNGSNLLLVQLGDAGGFEATGYDAVGANNGGPGGSTTGFVIQLGSTSREFNGVISLYHKGSNTWVCGGMGGDQANAQLFTLTGTKTLSAELTQVQLISSASDVFDSGTISGEYR